jgi:hypothetical protein
MDGVDKVDGAGDAVVAPAPAPVLEGEAGLRARYFARKGEIAAVRYVMPGMFVLGVPARDLAPEEWIGLSDEQRAAAIGSGAFVIEKREK